MGVTIADLPAATPIAERFVSASEVRDRISVVNANAVVITSYSIHYTKLYDQFLTGDVKSITDMSLYEDKDFYISGLAMTSELEPFGIMPNIMAVADSYNFV